MLYIHIPICASKCHYCGFYSISSRGVELQPLIDALCREIEARKSQYTEPLGSIYFGGGTPSSLPIEELAKIFKVINQNYDTSQVSEITLEGNPEHLTDEYLYALKKLGVNRLSMGIQSFSDSRLKYIGRKHSAQTAIDAVTRARKIGIENISIDLMFGFEDLSNEEWRSSIETALSLNVEHISAYQLTIEEQTVFARKGIGTASDEICFEHYNTLCTILKDAGYEHYEISNFSLPTYQSQHNSGYWSGEKYLGIGPSAHSYDGERTRSWNISSVAKYLKEREFEYETLTDTDLHNEFLMTHLRTAKGFSLSEYSSRFHRELPIVASLERIDDRVYIAEDNLFVSDDIISSLFL